MRFNGAVKFHADKEFYEFCITKFICALQNFALLKNFSAMRDPSPIKSYRSDKILSVKFYS